MKKKFLTLIIAFLCALICLSGCGLGSYIENNNKTDTPNKTDPENPPDDPNDPGGDKPPADDKRYVVTVYLGTQVYKPADEEIYVVWRNNFSVERVLLGENGTADAGELDGDYYIYLEGLSDRYTYNPSAYMATSEERKVSLLLTTVRSPESGDGKGMYSSEGCYQIKYDGTYRSAVTGSSSVLYYEYKPEAAGYYSVTSWVNAFENEINPYIQLYNGTIGSKWFDRQLDGGGFSVDGGYTKNFRYEYRIDRNEVGHAFTFAIGAESKSGDYPVHVDFAITYEGEYVSSNSDVRVIRAQEARIKASEKGADEVFTYADLGTKNFDANNFKLNDNTGFYHYYSETLYGGDPFGYGENFGPILCCALTAPLPSYTITTLYNANAAGLGGGSNYLRMYNVWIEEEQKFAVFDYTAFVREDYYRVCNSEGMCYVTEELKDFLQTYAERQSLYTDGVGAGDGTPEALGYTANQNALWLFACGVYLKTT
ncbi:MAG: hypothetical protein K2I30_04965 [Clostridia bacterium]|nr:hypothetical protein [Clostridia bacterium]